MKSASGSNILQELFTPIMYSVNNYCVDLPVADFHIQFH